eukprot:1355178-Amphidinium_carterae.1
MMTSTMFRDDLSRFSSAIRDQEVKTYFPQTACAMYVHDVVIEARGAQTQQKPLIQCTNH